MQLTALVLNRRHFLSVAALLVSSVLGCRSASEIPRSPGTLLLEEFVAGFRFYEGDAALPWLQEGDSVILKREPMNREDQRAIEVFAVNGLKLGYVPRDSNRQTALLLDQGIPLEAKIVRIIRSAPPWARVRIAVYKTN